MKLYWIMPSPPTERELQILKEIHGKDTEIEHVNPDSIVVKTDEDGKRVDIEATRFIVESYKDGFIYADSVLLYFTLVGANPNLGYGNFWASRIELDDGTIDIAFVLHADQGEIEWKRAWQNPNFAPGKYKTLTHCGPFNLLEAAQIAGYV